VSHTAKYDRLAAGFTDNEYADPAGYAERWAKVICDCSPGLRPGSRLLDLGCGDGLMAAAFAARGLAYAGVDASPKMVEAARRRHPDLDFEVARIEEYEPSQPVATTICLRAFFYAENRPAFFRRVAGYTRGTFVFDFRRPHFPDHEPILADLRSAGFASVRLRPFFLPQLRRLPAAAKPLLYAVEQSGPPARLLTRRIGRLVCVASDTPGSGGRGGDELEADLGAQ
jgi:SAM-dependent methyltransferase